MSGERYASRGESSLGNIAAVLGIIGALLGILLTLTQLGVFGDLRVAGLPGQDVAASLSISHGSGPSGTNVKLSGHGFGSNETVDIFFHTEPIATARADGSGDFSDVRARIPGSFDVFAPQTFEIQAIGRSSEKSAMVPFRLTTG
jgi:hypothetical protein